MTDKNERMDMSDIDDVIDSVEEPSVPVDELEKLVDKWEWDQPGLVTTPGYWQDECAQDLEKLIEEHK